MARTCYIYVLPQGVITFNSSNRAGPSRTASLEPNLLLAVVVIKVAHACVTS